MTVEKLKEALNRVPDCLMDHEVNIFIDDKSYTIGYASVTGTIYGVQRNAVSSDKTVETMEDASDIKSIPKLQTGMIVQTNESKGNLYMIMSLPTHTIGVTHDGYINISSCDYDDELRSTYCNQFDITKVYSPKYGACSVAKMLKTVQSPNVAEVSLSAWYDLIWERDDYIEITMDEIAEKFGVENVKIKIIDRTEFD